MSTISVTESLLLNSITIIIIVGALVFHKENFLRFCFQEGDFINSQIYKYSILHPDISFEIFAEFLPSHVANIPGSS